MSAWMLFWKAVFIVTLSLYTALALWVTVQGARDVGALLAALAKRQLPPGDPEA